MEVEDDGLEEVDVEIEDGKIVLKSTGRYKRQKYEQHKWRLAGDNIDLEEDSHYQPI